MFPADVTEINPLMSFAKREGTVYYFNGPMPVFSHADSTAPDIEVTQDVRFFPQELSWMA
jgi:hypothetical protein